jgi:hypothetical protein
MRRKNLLVAISIFLILFSCRNTTETDALRQKISLLQDSLTYYRSTNDSDFVIDDSSLVNSFFGKHEIAKLRMHGLRKAPQQVVDSLKNRTGLIPYKAELGGTMRFWNIQLIKTQWVIAEFTDGHVTGALLLSYQLNEDGSLQWKLLDSYLE